MLIFFIQAQRLLTMLAAKLYQFSVEEKKESFLSFVKKSSIIRDGKCEGRAFIFKYIKKKSVMLRSFLISS